MTLGATLLSYWPTLLVLPAYLGFANAWRLRRGRVLCYGLSTLSALLLGANLYQLFFVLTQYSSPRTLLEVDQLLAVHPAGQCAVLLTGALALFVLSCRQRLFRSLALGLAAWGSQAVATQYVILTQGFVSEINGVLPIQSVEVSTCHPGHDAPRAVLTTQRFLLCTQLGCERNHLLLFGGIGPLFQLRFDEQLLEQI